MFDATPTPQSLTHDELLKLVPADHIRPGAGRTRGDEIAVSLADLTVDDAATVRALYGFLTRLFAYVVPRVQSGERAIPELQAFVQAAGYTELTDRVRRLGAGLAGASPLVRKAFHDIRGGGLPGLVLHLDALLDGEAEPEDVERVFLLTRDQLKIVRNAIPDLDPAGYARDLEPRAHTTALLEKWSTTNYRIGDGAAELHLQCDFEGTVSECCMEFAALDRVIYNLVNNAARFAADGVVELQVFPIRDGEETDLRFVVANRISPEQREHLLADLGGKLGRVFEGGYTTGGNGLGLSICADLICHGYALPSLRAALDRGYLGARLVRDHFVAWFHWPAQRGGGTSFMQH